MRSGSPMVCGLWLMGMSETCGCFHDSAIHMGASLPTTTKSTHHTCPRSVAKIDLEVMGPGDLSSSIGWVFGDKSSSNAFSNNSSRLFFNHPFLFCQLTFVTHLKKYVLAEFESFSNHTILGLPIPVVVGEECFNSVVSMKSFSFFVIICVILFDVRSRYHIAFYLSCEELVLFDVLSIVRVE